MDNINLKKEAETQNVPYEYMGRKLVWHDEFLQDKLDRSKWDFERTMSAKDREYNNSEKHCYIKDGMLVLHDEPSETTENRFALPEGLVTKYSMNYKYGYLEAEACIQYRKGCWPSFWLKGDTQFSTASYMPEIDIFEVFSDPGGHCVANLHKWVLKGERKHTMLPEGEGSLKRAYTFKDISNLNNEFHRYGFEWTPEYMAFFVDGVEYSRYSILEKDDFDTKIIPGMAGFHDYLYVILNNELFTPGSSWKYDAWLATEKDFPVDYKLNWIRLYQKDGEDIKLLK